jgi:hypothetical protein
MSNYRLITLGKPERNGAIVEYFKEEGQELSNTTKTWIRKPGIRAKFRIRGLLNV